jgi:hemerythrin
MSPEAGTAPDSPTLDAIRPSPPKPRQGGECLRWLPHWTLGVDFMDWDHRCLVVLFNRCVRELETWRTRGALGHGFHRSLAALEALGALSRAHFRREEAVMREAAYPALAAHKTEHDLLLAEYTAMLREIRARGASGLDAQAFKALKQWLVGHLLGDDRALAQYLLVQSQASQAKIGEIVRRAVGAARPAPA